MASKNAVVVRKAAKLELKEIQNKKITSSQTQALEALLQDAYLNHRPKLSDYHLRRDLVKTFNTIAKDTYGNRDKFPVVVAFGSFVMDIFSAQSDLDLSINFSKNEAEIPRDRQVRLLRKIARKLYKLQAKGEMSGVKPIVKARVPIVKVTDPGTGIECDLSVENWVGMAKSHILHLISAIDERFKKLSLLMKYWAKAHKINSSKDRTLNSLSIVSLVAFHLQTRDPPILPPLSAIFRDGTDPVSVKRAVHTFLNYGDKNKETLAELFFTFLVKLASVEVLWPKGLCASTYKGSWMFKAWDSGVGCISVEDFFERSENVARAVKIDKVRTIYMCIHSSLSHILTFKDGQSERDKLIELLFGSDPNISQMGKKAKKFKRKAVDRPIPPDSTKTTKRIKGVWGGGSQTHASTASKGGWEGVSQSHASTTTKGVWGGESQTYANSATKGGWRGEWQTSANTATDSGWGGRLQTNGGWGGGSQSSSSTAAKGCWRGEWQANENTAINSGWGGGSQTSANSATKGGWRGEWKTSANTETGGGWGRGLQTNGGWGGGSQSSATKGGWRREWKTNATTAIDSGWGGGSQSYVSTAIEGGWREPATC